MARSLKLLFIVICGLISLAMFGVLAPGSFFIWQLPLPLIIKLVLAFLGLIFWTGFLYVIRYRLL